MAQMNMDGTKSTPTNTSSIASQIWDFFTGKGLSPTATAGIMGNLAQESSLNPQVQGGYLAQWGGSRLGGLDTYSALNGGAPSDLNNQLGFMWQEISSGSQGVTVSGLNSMASPQAAALYVSNKYERPASWAANNVGRAQYADIYYNEFMNGGTGSGAPQGGTTATGSSGVSQTVGAFTELGSQVADNLEKLDNAMAINGGWSILNPMKDGKAIAIRAFICIVGLAIILIGASKAASGVLKGVV